MNGWMLLAAAVLITLGAFGIGGRGKLDLGDFGKYTGPAGFILGLGALVLGIILPPF